MSGEETKAVVRRWYDDMWAKGRADLIPELAGPIYTRHEMGGTRIVSAEEYRDQTSAFMAQIVVEKLKYSFVAEGDKVCVVGTWTIKGADGKPGQWGENGKQWDWVQVFRAEKGRLVETWLAGIAMESSWNDKVWKSFDPE